MTGTNGGTPPQGFIKFDPERLMEASVKLARQHERLAQAAAAIRRCSEGLMSGWQSDSADLYRSEIAELDAQSAVLSGRLLSLSRDLAKTAGVYRAGEAAAKKKAETLPVDGVFLV